MRPDAIRLPVGHDHDAVAETKLLERIGLAVDDGVEPDPRTAAYSERDKNRLATDDVVCYVMKGHHAYGIGAALSVHSHPEHAIIWLEKARGFSGYDVRVIERHEARPREVRAGIFGARNVRSCFARRRAGPGAAIRATAGDEKERGYTNRSRNADGACSDEYLRGHLTVARHDTNQIHYPCLE